jgi:DNA polymerase-4
MRKIIHCDFDCFYAAIETRDNPDLKGLPIAIGGSTKGRGVIATCSYEARAYGIHSAMASAQALKLCPELILVHPNMHKYKEASQQAHQIYKRYSEFIEPLSLDEAFLDVSNNKQHQGSATLIAQALRKDIENEMSVTASAGIAPNKFLAKIASDWNKPNGQFTIKPDEIDDFVAKLPIGKIFGVGKVTERKMQKRGIKTCGDLRQFNKLELANNFGSFGDRLYNLSRGIDNRSVNTQRTRKSISVEHTYTPDIISIEQGLEKFTKLETELHKRCEKIQNQYLCTSVYVKTKFSDFSQTTVEKSSDKYDSDLAKALLKTAFKRKDLGVRLIGVGMKLKPSKNKHAEGQFSLDF